MEPFYRCNAIRNNILDTYSRNIFYSVRDAYEYMLFISYNDLSANKCIRIVIEDRRNDENFLIKTPEQNTYNNMKLSVCMVFVLENNTNEVFIHIPCINFIVSIGTLVVDSIDRNIDKFLSKYITDIYNNELSINIYGVDTSDLKKLSNMKEYGRVKVYDTDIIITISDIRSITNIVSSTIASMYDMKKVHEYTDGHMYITDNHESVDNNNIVSVNISDINLIKTKHKGKGVVLVKNSTNLLRIYMFDLQKGIGNVYNIANIDYVGEYSINDITAYSLNSNIKYET